MRPFRWATTFLADQKRTEEAGGQEAQRPNKRRAPISYQETRTYKRRASQQEMQLRRLKPARTRQVNTAQSTELGKRLRDNMEEIGRRCKAERRGDG